MTPHETFLKNLCKECGRKQLTERVTLLIDIWILLKDREKEPAFWYCGSLRAYCLWNVEFMKISNN